MDTSRPAETARRGRGSQIFHMSRSKLAVLATLSAACSSPPSVHSAGETDDTSIPVVDPAPPEALIRHPATGGVRPVTHLTEQISEANPEAREPDPRTDGPAWEAFYDPDTVHHITIEMSPDARDALDADGRTYVHAEVTIDGVVFPNAGVHRKGNTTYRSFPEKASIKIKLRKFGNGPHVAGLDRLTLNNMVSDPAQARENIALRLWAALGTETSRGSWATVEINGESYGLYSNIESMDDAWLGRRYREPGGDLWEANDEADFSPDGLIAWDLVEGQGTLTDMDGLAAAVADDSAPFDERISPYVDVDQFRAYWATCLVTAQTDGYPFHLNDAFVYADPGDAGRLDFFPWSMDEAWGDNVSTYTAAELAKACRADSVCSGELDAAIREKLDAIDALDLASIVADSFSTSEPYVSADTKMPYAWYDVQTARAELAARIVAWPGSLRQDLGM